MKKTYDLEERTFKLAKEIRSILKGKHNSLISSSDIMQVLRSSGSIGANYIEANESLSKKDFLMRIKICRKESKETVYWLKLISSEIKDLEKFIDEAIQLTKIFGAIIEKTK